jgi:uncharacterized protein YjeT (DUF2065 family)
MDAGDTINAINIGWSDLGLALGLAIFIEGVVYTLFPGVLHKIMVSLAQKPAASLRPFGLMGAFIGLLIIWFIKG